MGFPNSSHIRKFVKGQIVQELYEDESGNSWLVFLSGEKLKFYSHKDGIICTPYNSDGKIKQSIDIEKG